MKKLYLGCFLTLLCSGATYAQELVDSFEVYFQLNKATLTKESKTTIDSMLQATEGRRLNLRVSGHTCKLGTDNYNMSLSEKRAKSAFEFVKSKGEATDKVELIFFGEENPKYKEVLDPNRRVFVVMLLEDDDIDTLLKKECLEVFVEKGTYRPAKNKDITFDIKHYNNGKDFKMNNLSVEDINGRKLTFASAMYYNAKAAETLNAGKNIRVTLPLVKPSNDNMKLYKGVEKDGKIVWENTGKTCGPISKEANCESIKFEITENGYCACAMPRECEEDCSEDPYDNHKAPDLNAADIRHNTTTAVKFPNGVYSKDLSALNVAVKDDADFASDLDLCGYMMLDVTTEDVFANHQSVKVFRNTLIEAKDGNNAVKSNGNQSVTLYVKKSSLDTKAPVVVPGIDNTKGYIKWDVNGQIKSLDCLGSVNCEYFVFEVPATGNYKLAEATGKTAETKEIKYQLKTRVLKDVKILVGEKVKDANAPTVYRAKNAQKKGKTQPKIFEIRDYENAGNVVVVARHETKKGKKTYQEAKLSDLKFKASKKMYIMRKRDFKKVDDFKNMTLTKCK